MSWSIAAVGKDREAARKALDAESEKQAEGARLPKAVGKVVDAALKALPDSKLDGYDAVAISTYGHLAGDGENDAGNSSIQVSVSHVENSAVQ